MSETATRLAQLATLLRDPTPDGRRALLACVMDLYAGGAEACSESARDGFGLLLGDLSRLVDADARAALAARLASLTRAPAGLVEQLARDSFDVAAPLLEKSDALNDDALADIASRCGSAHAAVIATRAGISAPLASTILDLGHAPALAALVENPDVAFARADFETLLGHVADNAPLQAALIARPDLPADMAVQLLWHVQAGLGWQALQCALGVDVSEIADALTCADASRQPRGAMIEHPADAMAYAVTKERRNELKEPLIVRLLRDGDMDRFYACLDLLGGIDRAAAQIIIAEKSGYALAVACKAAGFARSTFSTLVRLSDHEKLRGLDQTFALMNAYESIRTPEARRLLGYWQAVFSGADFADLAPESIGRKAG